MAAFSYQNPLFGFDSFLVPNSSNYTNSIVDHEPEPSFSPKLLIENLQEIPLHAQIYETTHPPPLDNDNNSCIVDPSSYPTSLTIKHQGSKSSSTEKKSKKTMELQVGGEKQRHGKRNYKPNSKKQKKVVLEEAPRSEFVHVRARRGEATDSHSLAERVRREKISLRMKLLQSLVPGCDQIIGKAHILDEIIKYVQTLQTQVECLAAKLAAVNLMYNDFEMDFNTSTLVQEDNDNVLWGTNNGKRQDDQCGILDNLCSF